MNKEGFLKELREHLRVLDEREQEDIIDEYAQHIDLKMKSGLSEEEAISDFGNIGELASDILEAYHVDPKFEEKTKGIVIRTPDMEKVSEGSRKLAGKAGAFFGRIAGKIRKIKDALAGRWRAFRGETKERNEGNERMGTEGGERTGGRKNAGIPVWSTSRRLIHNCCVLIWNLVWIFVTCALMGMAALSLFAFGVLLILVFSGYPLLGAEIFCFGVAAAGASLGLLTFGLRKKYRKKPAAAGTVKQTGEVA